MESGCVVWFSCCLYRLVFVLWVSLLQLPLFRHTMYCMVTSDVRHCVLWTYNYVTIHLVIHEQAVCAIKCAINHDRTLWAWLASKEFRGRSNETLIDLLANYIWNVICNLLTISVLYVTVARFSLSWYPLITRRCEILFAFALFTGSF